MSEENKLIVGIIVGILCFVIVLMFLFPIYTRYQKRAEANNEIYVIELVSKSTQQKIEVEKQKAQVRVEEAKGIADSQKIIDQSLTENYLQYMAIQAQEKMAGSPNHTQIYIPVGNNGIPLIKTIE